MLDSFFVKYINSFVYYSAYFLISLQVVDVTCGYGFTVFAVNTKEKYKVFGTGINTDSQIG